jgi:hypothetical protein
MAGVLMKLVWQNISVLSAVKRTFCSIHGPQIDVSNSATVDISVNISDAALMQLIVNETNTSINLA